MPKSDLFLTRGDYAPVASRIALFHGRFPDGRIITELVSSTSQEVVFKASVFRDSVGTEPAATGWASERFGDGDVNSVACLENTETSAIGRALANLGFTASSVRPSREEMDKARRARDRLALEADRAPTATPPRLAATPRLTTPPRGSPHLQARANLMTDVMRLLNAAARQGANPSRIASLRARVLDTAGHPRALIRLERRLRWWLTQRAL